MTGEPKNTSPNCLEYEEGYRAGLESGLAAFMLNRNSDEAEAQIRRLWKQSVMRTDALLEAMWKEQGEQ